MNLKAMLATLAISLNTLTAMELSIQPHKENLRVLLVNTSDVPVRVAGNLAWGDFYRGINLRLRITGNDGKVHPFRAFISADPISPNRARLLYPSEILGRDISVDIIKSAYSLRPGKYRIKATYNEVSSDSQHPALSIQSNEVVVEIRD